MNKYIFPGADASCSLGWVVNQLEAAGFEVKNIDVLGVHYSATIWRWYKNWLSLAGALSLSCVGILVRHRPAQICHRLISD